MRAKILLINGILNLKVVDKNDLNEDLLKPLLDDLNTPGYISKLHLLYDKASKGDNSKKTFYSWMQSNRLIRGRFRNMGKI